MPSISLIPLFDSLEHFDLQKISKRIKSYTQAIPNALADYQQALRFLYSYRGSYATFSAYRRETERLLQWSWFITGKSIKTLHRHDFESFIEFCQKPPSTWIGIKTVARYITQEGERRPHPNWRPFVATISKAANQKGGTPDIKKYALSQKALQAIFSICGSFYNYLIQEDYVHFNPVTQIRQKSKFIRKQKANTIRRLSELQWSYILETVDTLAKERPDRHERSLFIMKALYGMYLRISELATSERWQPQMGHFQRDLDGNWWFLTVGKGNKERLISVSDDMLSALKRYRKSLGLTDLPSCSETTPLLGKSTRHHSPIYSTRQIRYIVQACFNLAFERMVQDGLKEEALELKTATVHWLRHTGISEDVKRRPREHVRDDAGHSSSATTDRYINIEMRERHASAKKKKLDPLA